MNPRFAFGFIVAITAAIIGIAASVVSQWKRPENIKLLPAPSNTGFNTQIGKIEI